MMDRVLQPFSVGICLATWILAVPVRAIVPPVDGLFDKAIRLSKAGKRSEAEALFRRLVRAQPRNAGAWGNLGLLQMRPGGWAQARKSFAEAFRLDPSVADFAAQASMASYRSGDFAVSESFARKALAKEPGNPTALSALAGSLVARGRSAEAVGVLRTLDGVRRGKDLGVVRSLLTAMAMAGGLSEALSECRRRMPKWSSSAPMWALLGDLSGQLGADRKDAGLLKEARSAYAKAFALDGKDLRSGVNAAQAAEMAGLVLEARAHYEAVVRKNPGFAPAQYGLGRVLLSDPTLSEVSRAAAARPHFEAALATEPRNPDYGVALGFVLGMSGQESLPAAISTLRAALVVAPKDGRARRGLVDFLVKSGDRVGALAEQRKLVADEPADKEAHQRLAGLLRTMGRDSEAWDVLRSMASRFSQDPQPLKELGLLLEQAGKLPEAEKALSDALARAPKDADLLTSLGLVVEKSGRRAEAIRRFREAIGLSPRLEAAHAALITALGAMGSDVEVRSAREAWVAADPSNNRARWELAQDLIVRGEDARALEQMRALVLRQDDPLRRTYLLGPAVLLQSRGRFDEAIVEYRRAMESDKSESVRLGYADLLEKAGRPVDARRELEELASKAKDPVPVRVALAGLLERTSGLDDAARVWEDLTSTHPGTAGLAENLLRIRRIQGRVEDAWRVLEEAALSGQLPPPASLVRAMEKESASEPDRHIRFCARLSEAFPQDRSVWTWRVEALLKGNASLERKREAVSAMSRLAALDPRDSEVEFRRGRLLDELGDRDGAISAYRESARRRPGGPAEAVLRAMGLLPEPKPKNPGKP